MKKSHRRHKKKLSHEKPRGKHSFIFTRKMKYKIKCFRQDLRSVDNFYSSDQDVKWRQTKREKIITLYLNDNSATITDEAKTSHFKLKL